MRLIFRKKYGTEIPTEETHTHQYTCKLKKLLDSRVSFKVSVVDGFNQLLSDLDDLLFTCWERSTVTHFNQVCVLSLLTSVGA